jgi:hypothetical protein
MDVLDRETLARKGMPHNSPSCVPLHVTRHATMSPLGDHALDSIMYVGYSGEHPLVDILEPLDATLVFGSSTVVENVRCHELIENCLVLFCRHAGSSFPQPPTGCSYRNPYPEFREKARAAKKY